MKRRTVKRSKSLAQQQPTPASYGNVLAGVVEILESARRTSARAVNAVMTAAYWEIGRRIVEYEQQGQRQAEYGTELLKQLSVDLSPRFGRGFSWRNLYLMRSFYLAYSEILQTPSAKFAQLEMAQPPILQTPSAQSASFGTIPARFPLPWSHYVRLLTVKKLEARQFYETEALRGGWSVRQLDRQISTLFYERTLASRNKGAMLKKEVVPRTGELLSPEEEIKDPLVLEFLDLKDEYSETELEEALIRQLETFLLELGGDFAFVGRQKRLRIDNEWYRVDLIFFHRTLRSLVVIDLKVGKFTHADAGQMLLYLGYAAEHWTRPGENPPVGLILCAQHNRAVAHYTLDRLTDKVLAAEYRMALPDEQTLAAELKRTQATLEHRLSPTKRRTKKAKDRKE